VNNSSSLENSYVTPPEISAERLSGKIDWLINLRWLASLCLFLILTFVNFVLKVSLPLVPLYLGNVFLIVYNCICLFENRRLNRMIDATSRLKYINILANVQITLDLSILTYLLHFSGSLENPFIFYYIFHMIISSILLTNRAAYLQATLTLFLFGAVIGCQYLRLLPHYHLYGLVSINDCILNFNNFVWIYLVLASTLYISVFMTTFIVNELRVREREMEISNRKLEEQDRLKSRYVLTVSNDIQNSLSTIQNLLKVSLGGYAGSISQNMKETLSRAEARSSSLLRFVRDLLNLSSMRAEVEIKKGPLDLIEVIDQQVEILKPEMEKKKLSFEMKKALINAIVNGNRIAMDQLFANQLSNAVKYTGRGGRITLTLEKSAVSGSVAICGSVAVSGSVQIEIADSGIGIPEENIPFIFEDFYRANNAKESEEIGTGLGLSIVKKIIETHGGTIRVDSQINRGTRFSLTLPLVGSEQ